MANIRLISTSTVQAANHKQKPQRIDLTPWDLQFLLLDSIQKGLLFHKPKTPYDETSNTLIHQLKTSLSLTLDFFPPLAGRLATIEHNDTKTSFFIDCNNAGALFVHAAADGVTVADIIKPIYVPSNIVYSFFPLNGVKNYEGISKPLLAVQATELVDGIFIGCTINHSVVDGASFWHFFNSWSEISRGSDLVSKPPVLERWFLDETKRPIQIPVLSKKQADHDKYIPPPNLQERVFHFTKENITKLKAKANAEIGTNKISSLQALLSHLWRSIIRSRKLDPDEETNFSFLIGVRPRLQPPLPEQYFGNAAQSGTITLKARKLVTDDQLGLGKAAWQMNEMIANHSEDKLRKFLVSWIENPRVLTMSSITSNAFVTSSSPRFDVYGNDFGWGKPIAVRSGLGNKYDGKITVFAGVEEGSVDIEACLSLETLEAMAKDAEFMEVVTIY